MMIKVNDCLSLAATMLQINELVGADFDNFNMFTGVQKEEAKLLLSCLNLVSGEIACEYYPITRTEEVEVSSLPFDLSSLSKRCIDVAKVEDLAGNSCLFKQKTAKLKCPLGKLKLTYSFLPEKYDFSDTTDFPEGRLTDRIVAYGIAGEYCLIRGLYREGLFWDKRYKDSLLGVSAKRHMYMPIA